MYKLAFFAAAAALAFAPTFASTSAEARTKVTVAPTYVPAIYCDYKSKDWREKGIVKCPVGWDPIGFPGTRWQVSKKLTYCWSTNTPAAKDYSGWWRKC